MKMLGPLNPQDPQSRAMMVYGHRYVFRVRRHPVTSTLPARFSVECVRGTDGTCDRRFFSVDDVGQALEQYMSWFFAIIGYGTTKQVRELPMVVLLIDTYSPEVREWHAIVLGGDVATWLMLGNNGGEE